jgi:hypothetical protein
MSLHASRSSIGAISSPFTALAQEHYWHLHLHRVVLLVVVSPHYLDQQTSGLKLWDAPSLSNAGKQVPLFLFLGCQQCFVNTL